MKKVLPPRQIKRLARWSAYSVSIVLLIALVSWLTVPLYLKKTLEHQVEVQIGRQLKVGQVTFNPLTLTVNIADIVLYEVDKKSPAFSADNLLVKASLTSLFHFAPVMREVVLTHPSLQLVRKQFNGKDVTNFSDVIARLAEHPGQGGSLRYSVSNIQIMNGAISFDDQFVGKKVQIDAITMGLPFVSNFSSAVDIFIEPALSAKVDGSLFELKGRSKPFFDTRETTLVINFNHVDLTQIIPFSPKTLPFKVYSAKLSSRLVLNFSTHNHDPTITLSGSVNLNDVVLSDFANSPLLKTNAINLQMLEANLMTENMTLTSLEIIEPKIWVGLNQQGALNWLALHTNQKAAPETAAKSATIKRPQIGLTHFQLKNGTIYWSDAANAMPSMQMKLTGLNIDAQKISTNEKAHPAKITISIGQGNQQHANFVGTINPSHAAVSGQVTLSDMALSDYQPYMNRFLTAGVSGKVSLKTQLGFRDGRVSLNELSGTLDEFKLQATNSDFAGLSAKKIAIENLSANSELKQARIEKIALEQVQCNVSRDANGVVNVINFLKNIAHSTNDNGAKNDDQQAGINKKTRSSGWQAEINHIALSDSNFVFSDKSKNPAVRVQANAVQAQLEQVSNKFDRPIKMTLRANLNKTGELAVDGAIAQKSAQLQINIQNFSVVALQPYFTDFLNITVQKGFVSTKGNLVWNAPTRVKYQGKLMVVNFSSLDKEKTNDFLRWKMLKIGGIDLDLGTKQQSITLGNIDLSDFFTRAVLSEQGKLNLENVLAHQQTDNVAVPVVQSSSILRGTHSSSTAIAFPATSAGQANHPVIKIGQVNFKNGTINYTDNFIKPHYSMRMTGMSGIVGAIQSNSAQSAPVTLNGKIDNDAPITISGSLNPLFFPILLDIKMTASGIDLPRLTSYSAKYAGYPIEKGKMSLNVEYHVKDNQLTANNTLKIDQLTFGEKVDSPNATHLPVPLIVSLLADRNGQINLDVPISGTINEPEFSVGGLFFKVLMNMLGKVFTSPFTLLTHSFSGGGANELSYIEFASGSTTLSEASKAKLDSLAKALEDHPKLKLDIIGRADLAADTTGLRERKLSRQIKKMIGVNGDENENKPVSDADREHAIGKIYSEAKFDKPRNKIGFAKSLPTAEMESMIMANTAISEDDLRSLAIRRESVVRIYLADTAHLSPERMYTIAPKISGIDSGSESSDKRVKKGSRSRVDFDLKM